MKAISIRSLSICLLLFVVTPGAFSQIWSENFNSYPNATTNDPPKWTSTATDCDDGGLLNEGPGDSQWGVWAGQFTCNDAEGAPCCTPVLGGGNDNQWLSQVIGLTGYCNVSISLEVSSTGTMECDQAGSPILGCQGITPPDNSHDQVVAEYSLDGGAFTQFGYVCGSNGTGTLSVSGLNGATLQIRVYAANKANAEYYYFDNVVVNGTTNTTPAISGIPASICQSAAPIALPTTQSGITGNWSGTGVSSNTFNPAGLSGNVTLTFTPNAGQCANIATATINVTLPTTPTISGIPASICQLDSPIALPTTQSGITGNWSGTGVSGNTFNPAGQSGNVTLTFTPNAGQCANPATTSISVTAATTPTISGIPASICEDATPIALPTTQSGITGNWSGTGVSGNTFNPAGQSGNVTLTFTPNAGQCANAASTSISVTTLTTPAITGIPASICQLDAPISLPTTQSGIAGNWSGTGVSSNNFNPAGQSGNVILTFTPTAGQCANPATTSISVTAATTPTISGLPASMCQLDAPVSLPTTQSGITGNWSGNGVSGNTFNPAGLSGNVTLTFTPSAGQCANPATAVISVTPAATPAISGLPASICQLDSPIALPTTQSGITGNWSGTGVSANTFNPAGLSGNVTLTFTPTAGQCANPANASIFVTAAVTPPISGIPASICEAAPAISLPTTQSGVTGNWSGNGVSGNVFDPAGLNGNITLTFTPTAGQCANPATTTIAVNATTTPTISGVPASICELDPPISLPTTQSGFTGSWSGMGVSSNTFNPAGLSGNVTLTFTPAANQCANPATAVISVTTPATPAISGVPASICELAAPVVLPTTQGGIVGNWSGNGVSGNTFNPAGLSGNVVLTFTPNAGQCANPATATVSVTTPTTPTISGVPASVCQFDPPVSLPTTQSGVAGNWSGNGVSGNNFNPAGLSGNVILTFTPTAGQCANPATTTVSVTTPTTPAISGVPASMCELDPPVALPTTQSGITGNWSGTGVSSNTFNPAGLSGNVTLTFTPTAGQCANPATTTVSVTTPTTPAISGVPASMCELDPPVALPTTQSGIAGNWSGNGVSSNTFNPAGLSGNVTLTFTPTAGQCANPATATVFITTPTTPTISGLPASMCELDPPVALPTTQSGIVGNWSGTGVSGNTFNPAGLSGNVTLTFTPTAAQCANLATAIVNVNAAVVPAISGVPGAICQIAAPIALPTTQSGIAGNWSGTGVSGNTFDPAGLSGNINLTFTPTAGQCAIPAVFVINVTSGTTPVISGVPNNICENAAPAALPTTQSGITGNWSGTGVSANNFNPSGLSGSFTLTFTPDAGQCANPATTAIFVETPVTPVISGLPGSLCELDAPVALPTVQSGISGSWSGNGVVGNTFDPAGLSGIVTLTFTPDASECANIATTTISVNTPATPIISGVPASMCELASPVSLPTTQSGIAGNWSGSGVSGNTFDPAGLSGNVILTFTPNAGQCANSATAVVNVNAAVVPAITGIPSAICQIAAPIALPTTQSGIAGNWSGTGVTANNFNPVGLSGNVTLTFTPNAGQCAILATFDINVTSGTTPIISGVPNSLCQLDPPVALPTTQSGITGNWSGTGVSANNFNPAGLSGNVTLTFTPDAGQCAFSATAIISVATPTTPTISGVPASICELASPVALPTTQSGISGNWSGSGVSGNNFDPAGLSGNVTLTFTPDAGQCANAATATISVTTPVTPVIAGVPASLCELAVPISLPTTQSGIAGNWSGSGVSGNTFDPAGLSGNVTLTFTPNAGQCANSAIAIVNVNAAVLPAITGIPSAICENATPISLPTTQSGIVGNWSGTGVSANNFNPVGLSGNVTLTFTPNAGQCAIPATFVINVTSGTTPIISGVPNSLCQLDPPVALPTTQSGITGNWSGAGVSANNFNPAGLSGNVTLTFTPDAGQCAFSATATISVATPTTPAISGVPASICELASPVSLPTTQSGISGNWSGSGVSGNNFDPAGLSGNVTLAFTPNAGQCANSATASISVTTPATPVIAGVPASICQTANPIALPTTQSGFTGNWSGVGVSSNNFNPASLNGNVTLTFSPDAGLCANAATASILVNLPTTPVISGLPVSLCESAAPVALPTSQSGIIGNWSGSGVSGNIFNPAGLSGNVVLTFTPNAGQCATLASAIIQVDAPVLPVISGVPASICETANPVALPVSQSGVNGNWSGTGVSGNTFNPAGLVGNVALTFTPNAGECANPASVFVEVTEPDVPQLGTTILCQTSGLYNLSNLADPNFPAGSWSGAGVSGNNFNPAGQSGNVNLTFTPSTPCTQPAFTIITVNISETPVIAGVPASLCQNSAGIALPTNQGGFAGDWSGAGVFANFFNPAGLFGDVNLTFTPDAGQCANSTGIVISLNTAPVFVNLEENCDAAAQTYLVSFDIIGGDAASYTVNGILVGGTSFISSAIASGSSYSFTLDDANGCDPILITGTANCACATNSGTMNFTGSPLDICNGNSFTVNHNGNELLDLDDSLIFVLHDNPGGQLGNVVATSSTDTFAFPAGVTLGQTYYVSAVAGSIGGGGVDLTDPCLSVSQGVPVVFYQPAVVVSPGGSICASECVSYAVQFFGEQPFSFDYQVVANGVPTNQTLVSDSNLAVISVCPADFGMAGGTLNLIPVNLADANCDVPQNPAAGLQITVFAEPVFNLSQTLCPGGSVVVNGTIYNESNPSGTEILANASANGCDSTVNVALNFNSAVVENLAQTLCPGEFLVVNGTTYNTANPSGSEIFAGGSYLGCDSVVNVSLSFHSIPTFSLIQTLCTGGSLTVNGTVYNESNPSGTEILANASANGCDSIVNVSLNFSNVVVGNLAQTLCPGEVLTVNGTTFNQANPAGTVNFPGGSYLGCDSVVNVSLSFFPLAVFDLNQTLCEGGSLTFNGTVYDESNPIGTEIFANASANGCDSTVNVTLNFNSAIVENLTQTLCPGEFLVVNGTTYDAANPSGSETFTGGSYLGCDSVVNVNLTFFPAAIFNLSQTLCTGGSLTVGNTIYNESNPTGTEILPGASVNGCDSTVNVSLNFNSVVVESLAQTLCPGEFLVVNGTTYDAANPSGSETFTGGSYLGCDSVVNVNLTFFPAAIFNLNQTLCTGGSLTVGNTIYNESNPTGTEILPGASVNGCDSTVNVSLNFNSVVVESLAQTLCPGEFLVVNGTTYDAANPSGSETFTGGSYLGCDSMVNVSLSFFQAAIFNLNQTLCTGGSLTIGNTLYDESNPTGVEILPAASVNGCDSTVNVSLSFSSVVVKNLAETLCPGEFLTVNGVTYDAANPAGSQSFPGGSYLGCDSVLNVSLMFFIVPVGHFDTLLQPGESITINGTVFDQTNPAGIVVYVGSSYTGCDSTLYVNLTFEDPESIVAQVLQTSPTCQGDSDGSVSVAGISGGIEPYSVSFEGGNPMPVNAFPLIFSGLESGIYELTISDGAGNLTTLEVNLAEPPQLFLELGEDKIIRLGEQVFFSPQATFQVASWSWSPPDYLDCTDCPDPVAVPLGNVTYTLTASDSAPGGCTAQDEISILVRKERAVFVPNAFSPNSDGFNDVLTVFGGESVAKIKSFRLFNRWGGLIHEFYNFPPNDIDAGWDGTFKGKKVDVGVYVWFAEVEFIDGETEILEGGVTLMR